MTVKVIIDGEPYWYPTVEDAVLGLLRQLPPAFLGRLKLDGLGALRRERRGVEVRTSQPAEAGDS